MDKQKEIEEMAKDLHSTHAVSAICSGKDCNHCKHADLKRFDDYTCIDLDLAEELVNKGYRKIPENAVVLTREEAVDLFNSNASGFMTSAIGDIPLNIDGMRKLVDEVSRLLIVQGELQELNAKYYNEAKDLRRKLNNDGAIYSRLEVDGFIDQARKGTVREIFHKIKIKVLTEDMTEDRPQKLYRFTSFDIMKMAREIVEEFGVVVENGHVIIKE